MQRITKLIRCIVVATALTVASFAASAQGIAYISSSSGYMIHNSGGTALTANWQGQAPIQGFGGYGPIRINGQCLAGHQQGQPLRWEGCQQGNKSQIWSLNGGRLKNEGGWCADVEGNRSGAGVRVIAYQCSSGDNQRFRAHRVESSQTVAGRIASPEVKKVFLQTAQNAEPGTRISLKSGKVISNDGATVIASSSAVIAAGGGNVIAAGGGN